MSEYDKQLVIQATYCYDWTITSELEHKAESEKAREIIHDITMRLYHREELEADCL